MNQAIIMGILICTMFTAGCFLLDPGPQLIPPTTLQTLSPTPESRTSTVEPSGMALQLSDLPQGYVIRERSEVAYSDVKVLARDEGWKKGYYVAFYRMNTQNYDITGITQQISTYPLDRIRIIFDEAKSDIMTRVNASVSVTELPFPKTGDRSIALRLIDANDQYGIMTYTVIFTKKDVLEQIEMKGTTTDYEVLKNIAGTAAGKIR
ncbi:MAG: hypothetical protein OS112_08370 [Methanoregula sp.]|nr:MAG: hypothetical protein OS112_08370 [Methanoregula sp.]